MKTLRKRKKSFEKVQIIPHVFIFIITRTSYKIVGVFSFFLSDKVNRNIVQAVRPVAGCGQSPNHCESKRMFTTDNPEERMRQQTQRAVE